MIPLAIAAGAARGLAGAYSAMSTGKRRKRSLKDEYARGDARLVQRQGDIRQATTEDLAARGLLNAGQQSARPAADPAAVTVGSAPLMKLPGLVRKRAAQQKDAEWMRQSAKGEVGLAGTIAAGVSGDLSKEFQLERQDLNTQKENGLRAIKEETLGGVVGSIGAGINTATTLQNAFNPAVPSQTPSGIPAFGGIDPIDPLSNMPGAPWYQDPFAPNYTQVAR